MKKFPKPWYRVMSRTEDAAMDSSSDAKLESNGNGSFCSCADHAKAVGLIGCSPSHRALLERLQKVARMDVEVLICGPTGVGKELYARYVHRCSDRPPERFIAINCGALPDALIENELFGHSAGAYTGAPKHADGLVAAAEGGTLLLDEVDSLSPSGQVKLLRLIQEREFRRLGETFLRKTNVRVVAATNADLESKVQEGKFRADLFYRLRVVPVNVPPLHERPEDIAELLVEFSARYADAYKVAPIRLTDAALARLSNYPWPGNIRELENCIRSLTCLQSEHAIGPDDLPLVEKRVSKVESPNGSPTDPSIQRFDRPFQTIKREIVARFEKQYLESALRRAEGNIAKAARLSGKHRRAFFELMRKHGLDAVCANTKDNGQRHS